MDLQTLETQLEQEVKRWENSAIKIGQLFNQIKESGVYKEAGYQHFQPYYRARWEERIGRKWNTAKHYMRAATVVDEMDSVGRHDHVYPVTDFISAQKLGTIKDPAERVEVWNGHVESGEKRAGYENLDNRIRKHKGEPPRETGERTVSQSLAPEDMQDLPSGEFDKNEKRASLTSKIVPSTSEDPAESAEACYKLYGENIDRHIRWADEIADFYTKYRDELVARQRAGIRAVK